MTQLNAKLQQAIQLHQMGNLQAAHALYVDILRREPNHYEVIHLLGVIANQTGNFKNGIDLIARAIAIYPYNPLFHSNLGNAHKQANQLRAAVAAYDKAISLKPDFADAYSNRGIALKDLKEFDAAIVSYDKAIALQPNYLLAHFNRGNALLEMGQFESAIKSFDTAIALKPDFAEAYSNRGFALQQLNRLDSAIASYETATRVNPRYAEAHFYLGNTLIGTEKLDAAIESYDRAIASNPRYAEAYCNRGSALKQIGQLNLALDSYEKAISAKPDYAKAFYNKGVVLQELRRSEAAIESFQKAIASEPGYADAYANLGVVLLDSGQVELAIQNFDKAIALMPSNADVLANRGNAFMALKKFDSAIESFEQSFAIKPDQDYLLGTLLSTKMRACDWKGLSDDLEELVTRLRQGNRASLPFSIITSIDSAVMQKTAADLWVKDMFPLGKTLGDILKYENHPKIRIGYYSADYHNHATSYLMAGLFELHDRSRFELVAFSYGPDVKDEMRQRVAASFDKFIDVRTRSDLDIARLSRDMEIDIAVDLKGFTKDARTGIFALRCAPIQVNYLGYPGTMGADFIDYLIADKTVIPVDHHQYYTEKIAYLPFSYQVNDSRRAIAELTHTRSDVGLPTSGFVFCCFNNSFKITPSIFGGWMRILQKTEDSVLWLLEDNAIATNNLRKEAVQRGVDSQRLVFAKRVPLAVHLARQQLADLFIDTLPYNAHTTASDALWSGLPVLTLVGESFSSRVAASLLRAVNLPELITNTQEAYEARAIELAANPEALKVIRQKLATSRLTAPLFDTKRFARHIEAVFSSMYDKYQSGLPPQSFEIEP